MHNLATVGWLTHAGAAVKTIDAMEAAEPEKLESMPLLQLNKVQCDIDIGGRARIHAAS